MAGADRRIGFPGWELAMGVGASLELVGTLQETDLGFVLFLDGGGFWVLDFPGRPDVYLGKYLRVRGRQLGFNLLEVAEVDFLDLRLV